MNKRTGEEEIDASTVAAAGSTPATADEAAEAPEVAPLPDAPEGMSDKGRELLEGVRAWHDGETTDDELVDFLVEFEYAQQTAPRPKRPTDVGGDDMGRWYNEVDDYVPSTDGTWAQVDGLVNTGAIDRELYYRARERVYGV